MVRSLKEEVRAGNVDEGGGRARAAGPDAAAAVVVAVGVLLGAVVVAVDDVEDDEVAAEWEWFQWMKKRKWPWCVQEERLKRKRRDDSWKSGSEAGPCRSMAGSLSAKEQCAGPLSRAWGTRGYWN